MEGTASTGLKPPSPAAVFVAITLPSSPRLFLVDGYALIYRAFFALISRPLTTSHGENTSAAWGVVNFLDRLRTVHKPEYIAWVYDAGLSFRHEQYSGYKATREKLSEELQNDFDRGMERIEHILEAYRIPILTVDGYEADDVIGTLAIAGVKAGVNVVIVSGDKDFHQLVRVGIWLLNPGRGGPAAIDEHWIGVENGDERLGVPPDRVTDYLALVGDTSDNVPGVPGIGEKTARELIKTYGALETILEHRGEISGKRPRDALINHETNARLSKELVTIRTDVPISLDLEGMRVRDRDVARLHELYVELEFHALAKTLPHQGDVIDAEATHPLLPVTQYVIVTSPEQVTAITARAEAAAWVAIHTDTAPEPGAPASPDPLRSRLIGLSLSFEAGVAYYFPLAHNLLKAPATTLAIDRQVEPLKRDRTEPATGADQNATVPETVGNLPALKSSALLPLRRLLEDARVIKVAHDGKHDMLVLWKAGVALAGPQFDTMIASYVLDPGRRSHALDILALEFLSQHMTSYEELCGKGTSATAFDDVEIERAGAYSGEIAETILRLRAIFADQLEATGASKLFREVEMPLLPVLAKLEWTGMGIDVQAFTALKRRLAGERSRVEEEIYALAGEAFNINSTVQMRDILFVKLGLPVLKRTSTGPSTDVTVLQQLAEGGHALPALLMEYRELSKLENTYIDALPALVNPHTGRVHTSFGQTVAATGRLSSSDPNLQNIPIRRELGREIRRAFIPSKSWMMLGADYSQIELRLLAHLSQDVAFLTAFRMGGDIHRETAARIFDVPVEQVTSEMRSRAKTINFATIYGQGPHALARQLRITHAEAREFIDRYFKRFSGVRRYLDTMVEFARTNGYVETILGRRRYIPELRDKNFNIRSFGERTAQNTPLQGSAADLIKIAMISIDRRLVENNLAGRMLMQVHDELVFEAPPAELDRLAALVRHEMEGAAALSVPLVVDIATGNNWLETKS